MPKPTRQFRIFLSAPDNVQTERDAIRGVVDELNNTLGEMFGITLTLVRWETHSFPAMGRPGAVAYEQMGPCDIFIGILWWRFGRPDSGDSGTEEEFRRAVGVWEHGGSVRVMLYFREEGYRPRSPEENEAYGRVLAFEQEMRGKARVGMYPSAVAFADAVRQHLMLLLKDLAGAGMAAAAGARDLGRARGMIAREVLADLAALDARMGHVLASTAPDAFDARMQAARQAVAPSAADAALAGYRRLIAEQRITSLRQTLNAHPLRSEFGAPLIQMLGDSEADIQPVRFFYDQLAEVQWATESLLSAMAEAAQERSGTAEGQAYVQKRVALAMDTLANRSERAHVAGLLLLGSIGPDGETGARLSGLSHLEPRALLPLAELRARLDENVRRQEALVARKRVLVEEGECLLEIQARDFEAINEQLEIRPTDTWNEVVGKAISLRQFGRTAEAVAAFDRYGQMFSSRDPTAAGYARVAQAFTLARAGLGVEGGVYVFQVGEPSAARAAGLAVGDVIVEYNGRTIQRMPEMMEEMAATRPGNWVRVSYLRHDDATGRFTPEIASVEGGPLGAGMMPI